MRFFGQILVCGLLLLLTSCAAMSPGVTYYVILPDGKAEPLDVETDALSIAVGPADFPTYLQRNQIVTRYNNRLEMNEYHRWGASFESSVLSVIGENVRQWLNTSHVIVYPAVPRFSLDYRLVLDVIQLDGQLGEEVVLNVRWMILDTTGKDPMLVKQTRLVHQMEGSSHDELVDVYGLLLAQLSKEMAEAVVVLHKKAL